MVPEETHKQKPWKNRIKICLETYYVKINFAKSLQASSESPSGDN